MDLGWPCESMTQASPKQACQLVCHEQWLAINRTSAVESDFGPRLSILAPDWANVAVAEGS